jgi:hypothetical protein
MLGVFAFFALFPHEMSIDTHASEVRDVFRLQGIAGRKVSAAAEAALRRDLEKLRFNRPPPPRPA